MDDMKDLLKNLLPGLTERGLDEAVKSLDKLSGAAKNSLTKSMLTYVAEMLDQHGPTGLDKAQRKLFAMLDGKEVDIELKDLRAASDLLAAMQNAEADEKTRAKDVLRAIGQSAGTLLGSIIKGVL